MADDVNSANAETLTLKSLDLLPTETLTRILAQPELHFSDVVNFGATCKRFHAITNDNELWKIKLLTRWPCLRQATDNAKPSRNWLHLCKGLHQVPHTVQDLVSGLSAKCFHMNKVNYTDFHPLRELYLRGKFHRALIEDILMGILNGDQPHKDLTMKYYTQRVLRYVRHIQLSQEWQAFFALPIRQQNLLEGAILLERWYNTFSPPPQESIRQQVAQIANQARGKLKMDHPCCHDNTEGVVEMTADQCKEVFDAVNEVLYEELKFKGNSKKDLNKSNLFMSLILTRKLGFPITLCILYEAVVRRLGVVLRPVDFPDAFLLSWNYSSDGFKCSDTKLFIDTFKKGCVMTSAEAMSECLHSGRFEFEFLMKQLQPCMPKDVFTRITTYIMHFNFYNPRRSEISTLDTVELETVLHPEDFEKIKKFVNNSLLDNINYLESLEMLQKVRPRNDTERKDICFVKDKLEKAVKQQKQDDKPSLPPKRREENKDVTYAIGMIMRHRRSRSMCVIRGWDPVFTLPKRLQVDFKGRQLSCKEKQPFYNVLFEDSNIQKKYYAQEELEYIDVPVAISHPDIGKYFQEFTQTCYLPNEQLAQQYPDDTVITTQKAAELYAN